MIKKFIYILFASFFLFVFESVFSKDKDQKISKAEKLWKVLPIQHQGRVKPFDTFSREVLRKVYGKESYKKRSAVEVILSWLIIPDFWDQTELIFIEDKHLQKRLDLPIKQKRFHPLDLQQNKKLAVQLVELKSLKQRKEPLDSYFQNLEKLETKLLLYGLVQTGFLIRLEPQPKNSQWLSLSEMSPPFSAQFKKLISSYVQLISEHTFSFVQAPSSKTKALNPVDQKILDGFGKNKKESQSLSKNSDLKKESLKGKVPKKSADVMDFQKEMADFKNSVLQKYPLNKNKIQAEVFYNHFRPFQKAWILYFLFLMALALLFILKKLSWAVWLSFLPLAGFLCHSLGMLLRSYIMSRPPVSNMYETVLWVPWVAILAGAVFYFKGIKIPFVASMILSAFCLLLTSLAPEILDGSLQPLEAVLNSSFWLTTHVLIITMSYSFFFLAFVLGDMALLSYFFKPSQSKRFLNKMYSPIYRSLQWGVVFLAGGTILGGVWADYSWGRFWGWDPKESWALVSLLAYLALLHGRLLGWIKSFGMALGAVLMFFFVIMAWYGVNFVLGAGLHSYGFGSGGIEYVLSFVVLHLILCGLAFLKHKGFSFNRLIKR